MWGFHECCSRCKTNDSFDHVTKKISCSGCDLSIATTENPKYTSSGDFLTSDLGTSRNPSSHPVSLTTTEPNSASASSDDDNLGLNPFAVTTTQQSNASSDRSSLRAKVRNQATEISEQIKRERIAMGEKVRFGASIYIACRQNGMALSIKDICSVANGAQVSKISSAVRTVVDKLGLPPQLMHIRAAEFAKRYSTNLQMDSQAVKAAEEAAERCTDLVNRAPSSVAATVVYVIAQLSYDTKRLKDIKKATGVQEYTIRGTYKDLYPHLSRIIPTWFANANDLKKLHSP
ncbi:hypothetical protein N665_2263s0005 [Sinapis alba]|nr:hypothetical protein N665_2263s0005 [Sinapis alba]